MFTGIVEERGIIKNVIKTSSDSVLAVEGNKVTEGTAAGDSIAVNGVCLTVTKLEGTLLYFDVMNETFRKSSLGQLKNGDRVNLERALCLDSRLGGHIVSGHIDGTGSIRSLDREDNALWITIEAEDNILKYVVPKGSIAIDGVSLTVADVSQASFRVSIIPHTRNITILEDKRVSDMVNLECDIIGKYVERFFPKEGDGIKVEPAVNQSFLNVHGFI